METDMTREEAIEIIKRNCIPGHPLREACEMLIPELAESEDERIRKHIIEILESLSPCHWNGNEKSKCIAYLEKKKVNTEGDFGRGYDCGYQAGYAVAMNEMKQKVATATLDSEKQKEQKPRWEINNPHTTKWTKEMIDEKFEELVEPKPEWSEEGEKIYKTIYNHFHSFNQWACSNGVTQNDVIRFLNSLKNRGNSPESNTNSPSWKPSGEQMVALLSELPVVKGKGDRVQDILESLYNDLKKL